MRWGDWWCGLLQHGLGQPHRDNPPKFPHLPQDSLARHRRSSCHLIAACHSSALGGEWGSPLVPLVPLAARSTMPLVLISTSEAP